MILQCFIRHTVYECQSGRNISLFDIRCQIMFSIETCSIRCMLCMGMHSLTHAKHHSTLASNITMQLFQDALVSRECNLPGVFGGCDCVARFRIIRMVSPCLLTYCILLDSLWTTNCLYTQTTREERVIVQRSINIQFKLRV